MSLLMEQETKIGFSLGEFYLGGFLAGFFTCVCPIKCIRFLGKLPVRLNPDAIDLHSHLCFSVGASQQTVEESNES